MGGLEILVEDLKKFYDNPDKRIKDYDNLKPTMVDGKPFANGVPIINLHIHSKNTGDFI